MKRPLSERKLAANRQNAKLSTGPRTAEGKAVSRYNAVRHGFFLEDAVALGPPVLESPLKLMRLMKSIRENLGPVGELQEAVADEICRTLQDIEREKRYEAGIMRDRIREWFLDEERQILQGDAVGKTWSEANGEMERHISFIRWLDSPQEPDLFQDEEYLERVYLTRHDALVNRPQDWRTETRTFVRGLTLDEKKALTESLFSEAIERYIGAFDQHMASSPPPLALVRALVPNQVEMDRKVRHTNHYARYMERYLDVLHQLQHWQPGRGRANE